MITLAGIIVSVILAVVGWYFKYEKKSGVQGVATTSEAMLKAAVDRPKSVDDAIDRL